MTKDILSNVIGPQPTETLMRNRTKPRASLGLWLLRLLVIGIPAFLIFSVVKAGSIRPRCIPNAWPVTQLTRRFIKLNKPSKRALAVETRAKHAEQLWPWAL